jgi:hypothetical protein
VAILWPCVLLLGIDGTAVDRCRRWLGLEVEEIVRGDVDDRLKSRATRFVCVVFGNMFNFQQSLN